MASDNNPQILINGEWQDGQGTDGIAVFDPARGEQIAELAPASIAQVDDAVASAKAAFESWSALSLQRRVQHVYKMRQNMIDNVESLARTLTLDQGKTLDEARGEVQRAAEYLEAAIAAPMLYHSVSGNVSGTIDARLVREPLGVCVAVTPLNFPVMNPTMFAGWALVSGNTLVLKPSETDPLASTAAYRVLQLAGLPDGVLNLVHGRADVAQHLIGHSDVSAVSCITSTPVAKAIYLQASAAGKRVQANGGAKNPIVVAADADLELAAEGIVSSAFGMSGQRCLAGTRIVVEGDRHDELVDRVAALTDKLVLGSGFDKETTMGPVVSAASKARIENIIERSAAAGATLVRDGRNAEPTTASATADGYFLAPTIMTDISHSDPVSGEETFGPAIAVHRADSVEEATAIANDTEFGNASTIYTKSGTTARYFERASTAGNVGVNSFPAPPFNFKMGGIGESFFGQSHVGGDSYLRFYTQEKLVVSRW